MNVDPSRPLTSCRVGMLPGFPGPPTAPRGMVPCRGTLATCFRFDGVDDGGRPLPRGDLAVCLCLPLCALSSPPPIASRRIADSTTGRDSIARVVPLRQRLPSPPASALSTRVVPLRRFRPSPPASALSVHVGPVRPRRASPPSSPLPARVAPLRSRRPSPLASPLSASPLSAGLAPLRPRRPSHGFVRVPTPSSPSSAKASSSPLDEVGMSTTTTDRAATDAVSSTSSGSTASTTPSTSFDLLSSTAVSASTGFTSSSCSTSGADGGVMEAPTSESTVCCAACAAALMFSEETRQHVLGLLDERYPAVDVAEIIGCSRRSMRRWMRIFEENGTVWRDPRLRNLHADAAIRNPHLARAILTLVEKEPAAFLGNYVDLLVALSLD
ncbi:hypothetical protein BU14_0366s0002 [Porphyra umbilicalis]|uniref:Uncharacterized protein n=1 Tax=Porphyra umbilicalis TaxID=2786 RepID=A0A1X6NXA1_PORUM|nr:hypothetical protein BU14_0366s0002 [Porphyra umbilicalis]|eukprot:OSX73228.1 hypothetical protein BU14_0366s0002 [Porphyra umbilicalis]